jgi:hypothetical protein
MANNQIVANPIWFGFNAPFIGGQEGVLSRQVNEKIIRNDLLQLLLTSPGERVMRPDFGTPIRRFLFQNLVEADLVTLQSEITEKIEEFEKRVRVTKVMLIADTDQNLLTIKIFGEFVINRQDLPTASLFTGNIKGQLLVELGLPTNPLNVQPTNGQQVI